jgi:hypothetical protein
MYMYLLGSCARLQSTQAKTDGTGTVIITADLPLVTAKSWITTRPAPFLIDAGDLVSRGATRRLGETDVGNGNGELAGVTTPIVAALLGVGAVAVEGAVVYADASHVGSNSRTRVEQLLVCDGKIYIKFYEY